MGDVRVDLKNALASLPGEASWDEIWQTLTATADAGTRSRLAGAATTPVDAEPGKWLPVAAPSDLVPSASPPVEPTGQIGATENAHADIAGATDSASEVSAGRHLHAKAIRLKVTAFVVLGLGLAVFGLFDQVVSEVTGIYKLLIQGYVVALVYVTYRIHRSGRFYAQKAAEMLSKDGRAPVLYLRSFKADEVTTKVKTSGITEEEQLVAVLRSIGPVIALDDPASEILSPGATRISASNDDWQARVLDLMSRAQLVVIRLGDTPSLNWEIAQARQMIEPSRLVLMVPAAKSFDYDQFRLTANRVLGLQLPDIDFTEPLGYFLMGIISPRSRSQGNYSFRAFIRFEATGKATPTFAWPSWRGYLHSPLTQPLRANVAYALRPVFEGIGLPWPKPRLNWILLVLVMLIGGGGVVGLLGHLLFGSG